MMKRKVNVSDKFGFESRKLVENVWECTTPNLFRDRIYSKKDWDRHVTWYRHLPEPIIFLQVFQGLSPIILWLTIVTVSVGMYAEFAPEGYPKAVNADFVAIFTLMSFALALLLVFRTNSSYARWWEARMICGAFLNHVRNINRYAMTHINDDGLKNSISKWTACFPASTYEFLRKESEILQTICRDVLTPEEMNWLRTASCPPVSILQLLSVLFQRAGLDSMKETTFEQMLNLADISVGSCQRISSSPIPLMYTRHLSRFLLLWLTFLPFALWDFEVWVTIPTMTVVSFLLLGIENIAVQIEEPFRVLPLMQLAQSCRDSVFMMKAERKVIDQIAARAC